MTTPNHLRPRSHEERLKMATALAAAPRVVALEGPDDGWRAACLRVAGRVPVRPRGDGTEAEAASLARLGLPPLGDAADLRPGATLGPELVLRGSGLPGAAPLPPAEGPLVSILVCTFERADLLQQALASARAQTWPHEIVVVDDGSRDETPRVLEATEGVRWFRQPRNQGKPAALERGLAEVRGEAVLVLDDDDLLLPGALHVLAPALFRDETLAAVYGDAIVFDGGTGRPLDYVPATRQPPARSLEVVLQQVPGLTGACLARTRTWRSLDPMDPTLLRGEDMDLFLGLAQRGGFTSVPLPTFLCRVHDRLRGALRARWHKQRDPERDRQEGLACIRPVFLRRYQAASPVAERAAAHAWAVGLHERGLAAEARAEAARWSPPWSRREAWVRTHLGLATTPSPGAGALVVVDDGDEGALEETLHRHAARQDLWVDLEVPRDPLGHLRLHWPGTYGARERLHRWVEAPGPWTCRLTSAPGWTPPALEDLGLVPDLPAPEALRVVAAVLGWDAPTPERPGLPWSASPLLQACLRARSHLDAGAPAVAMGFVAPLLQALPAWRGGWWLAAEAFSAQGRPEDAARCRQRAIST